MPVPVPVRQHGRALPHAMRSSFAFGVSEKQSFLWCPPQLIERLFCLFFRLLTELMMIPHYEISNGGWMNFDSKWKRRKHVMQPVN